MEQLLVETGRILGFADNGALRFSVSSFDNEAPRVEALKAFLNAKFERHAKEYGIKPLSSTYNGTHTRKVLGHLSTDKQIVEATCNHNVVTVNTSDNEIANGYMTRLIASLHKERRSLAEVADLHNRLRKSHGNSSIRLWLRLLGIITILFGFVIWNRVPLPSEVTHYETGEFVYYGPLKNGKPHGTGGPSIPRTTGMEENTISEILSTESGRTTMPSCFIKARLLLWCHEWRQVDAGHAVYELRQISFLW